MIPMPAPLPSLRDALAQLAAVMLFGLILAGAVICWLTPEGCSLLTGLCS